MRKISLFQFFIQHFFICLLQQIRGNNGVRSHRFIIKPFDQLVFNPRLEVSSFTKEITNVLLSAFFVTLAPGSCQDFTIFVLGPQPNSVHAIITVIINFFIFVSFIVLSIPFLRLDILISLCTVYLTNTRNSILCFRFNGVCNAFSS